MKHLFYDDWLKTFMVYFRPKDKARLYELIFNLHKEKLPRYSMAKKLAEKGFKVVDITDELNNKFSITDDLTENEFVYQGRFITENEFGYSFTINNQFNSVKTIEEAIETIDKELGNAK